MFMQSSKEKKKKSLSNVQGKKGSRIGEDDFLVWKKPLKVNERNEIMS